MLIYVNGEQKIDQVHGVSTESEIRKICRYAHLGARYGAHAPRIPLSLPVWMKYNYLAIVMKVMRCWSCLMVLSVPTLKMLKDLLWNGVSHGGNCMFQ